MADAQERASAVSRAQFNSQASASSTFKPLFQILATWERQSTQNRLMTGVGVLLELLQFCAFAIAPLYKYQQPIVQEFTFAVFATVIPLWDNDFGPVDYAYYIAPVAVLFVILLAMLVVITAYATKKLEQSSVAFSSGVHMVMEAFATWMYLPALHIFMGGMWCRNSSVCSAP